MPVYALENTAPYFAQPLENIKVKAGEEQIYLLPAIIDLEGDNVKIRIEKGSASIFSQIRDNK